MGPYLWTYVSFFTAMEAANGQMVSIAQFRDICDLEPTSVVTISDARFTKGFGNAA
jgi:hypothetical protein